MSDNLKKIKEKITPILKANNVSYCAVFGSFARGEEREDSDIDFVVNFNSPKSLFDFAGIKLDLEEVLNREVDLVMKNNIKPLIKSKIEKSLITLYEER